MAVICISVVRCCKAWEDARTIFLVVIIVLVAVSTGFDQDCVTNLNAAGCAMAVLGLLALTVCDGVLLDCRLRFPIWYENIGIQANESDDHLAVADFA